MGVVPELSIVCPVYQGEHSLTHLVEAVDKNCQESGIIYDLILVDDGSSDNSWLTITELQKRYPITAVKQAANYGQHYAIHAGLRQAKGRKIMVMDCDLQDDPACIPLLLEASGIHRSSVLAFRKTKKNDPYYVVSSWFLNVLLTILTRRYNHYRTGNFGVFDQALIRSILQDGIRNFYFPAAVRIYGGHLPVLVVRHGERKHGSSTYTFSRQLKLALQALSYALFHRSGNKTLPYQTETIIYTKFDE